MGAKERNERYDVPEKGALILVHGRVHEVTETWEGTGPRIGEKGGCYTRHDPGDGTAPTKHIWDEGTPWRPATGQPWDEDRTTPAERALRIRTLAHHADREALQAVLEAGALALVESGHESRTVERLVAAIAGTFDPCPPEYALDRKVHLLNGDEAPLPGALTSHLVPCPLSFNKSYTLDTAQPPFREGMNSVSVCAYDYAQTGTPNGVCKSHEVLVNNLCPGSSVAGGKTITAGFAGNKQKERTLSFHRKALIRGRLVASNGQPVAGAQVCIQAHTDLEGRPFHLVATTTTNQNGGWSYKTNRGPSRVFRVGYRSGAFETSTDLALHIRSRSTLHLSTHRTPIHKKVYFSGELPGPSCAGRTVYVSGTVPGAKRRFLVRQATTDALCHFRKGYAFSPIPHASRFVFWVNVPEQAGYPYRPGRSVNRYIRVSPHPPKSKKSRSAQQRPDRRRSPHEAQDSASLPCDGGRPGRALYRSRGKRVRFLQRQLGHCRSDWRTGQVDAALRQAGRH